MRRSSSRQTCSARRACAQSLALGAPRTCACFIAPRCAAAQLIPLDEFLPLLYGPHDPGPGLARVELEELFAEAPRLNALAVRPMIAYETKGMSDTENSPELLASQS